MITDVSVFKLAESGSHLISLGLGGSNNITYVSKVKIKECPNIEGFYCNSP